MTIKRSYKIRIILIIGMIFFFIMDYNIYLKIAMLMTQGNVFAFREIWELISGN